MQVDGDGYFDGNLNIGGDLTGVNMQDNRFWIDSSNDKLCYNTNEPASCNMTSSLCLGNLNLNVHVDDPSISSCPSESTQDSECASECGEKTACDGDATSFDCGTPGLVMYSSGNSLDCSLDPPSGYNLQCVCGVNENYNLEQGENVRCI